MKQTGSILLVDDNTDVLSALEILLEDEFEHLTSLSNPNQIPSELQNNFYHVVLLDMNFTSRVQTGNEGIYWLREILKIQPQAVVVMFTAYGDVNLAVKAMKEGATDFIMKPWDNEKLLATLKAGVQLSKSRLDSKKLERVKDVLLEEVKRTYPKPLGKSAAFDRIQEIIDKTAPTDANILLTGENGTGKSLIAREIHDRSLRKDEPFVTVDLGSIAESLFESELFGYKKGAFTDAIQNRIGRIETAHGGTLFLDEIGNLSKRMQMKLLSVLQEKQITPLGSGRSLKIDIRLICATNKNLSNEVAEGKFREDLYYRINTIDIEIPPLRERPADIVLLSEVFFQKFKLKYKKVNMQMTPEYVNILQQYKWPGNVRELEHAIEQSVILAEGVRLKSENFYLKNDLHKDDDHKELFTLEDIEKKAILQVLKKHEGNQVKAAKELNITRQTIYNKMKKYGL